LLSSIRSLAMLAAMRRAWSSIERLKKNPKRRDRLGSEVLQFRLWAEQRGCRGDGGAARSA
jgi:hypothetical protein